MQLRNPLQLSRQVRHAALGVALKILLAIFLLLVVEAGGKAALGILVHIARADLKLNNLLIGRDDRCMETLVAVWLGDGNIVFDASNHRLIERVENAQH